MINKLHVIFISFFMALGFLTRLPIPNQWQYRENIAFQQALWAFPIIGIIIGAILSVIAILLQKLGMNILIIGIIIFAVNMMITGALHEDGFADSFDSLWGGYNAEKRLEIMRDSHIGVYGVLALIIMAMLKIILFQQLLTIYADDMLLFSLYIIMVFMLSRGVVLVMLVAIPVVKQKGLANDLTSHTTLSHIWFGLCFIICILSLLAYYFMPLWHIIILPCAMLLIIFIWGNIAKAKIGGYNGDILGALVVLTELLLFIIIINLV